MPLVDLSMVEQRYDAVREVLDGATVKDTAIRYGVDRRTLHRWLVRHATDGLAALADKSSRPDRCPHQTGRLGRKPANVAFDRICLNNGIRHILTAPYSPTTTGKIGRPAQDDAKGVLHPARLR